MVPRTRTAVKPSRPTREISSPHKAGHPGLRQDRWLAAHVLLRTGSAAIRLRRYSRGRATGILPRLRFTALLPDAGRVLGPQRREALATRTPLAYRTHKANG